MNKKILAVLLAFLFVASSPVTAFAEDTVSTDESTATIGTTSENGQTELLEQTGGATEPDPSESSQPSEPSQPTQPTEPSQPTQPTEPSQPTQPTEPSQPTQPTTPSTEPTLPSAPPVPESTIPTALTIDTENIYDGMDKAYEDGYVPRTENGFMYIVLPMLSNGNIYQNRIKVSLGLGSGASSPFVMANYEKTFEMKTVTPKNSNEEKELFLIEFTVKLSSERINGVYPVAVNISGYDDSGTPIDCSYTIYVTITDGKSNQVTQPAPEVATAEPVVYISNSVVQPDKVMAGEEFTLTVTLKNSLATKSVKNMLVKIDTGNLHINLLENTNVFQVDKIPAGGETELTFRLASDASIPAGKYNLNFTFNYDSSKTLNLSSSGSTIVEIHQPANMELVMPRFAQSVTVGETIPLSLQVMNMGRDPMYNVRCTVSGFGFAPSNTGYIGTMDAGSSATTEVELYIIALNASKGNENGSQYGNTIGTVTLIYEDETGQEYQQETQFETTVNRPVVEVAQTASGEDAEEKAAGQWWISVLILGGVILAAGIGFVLIKRKKKNRGGVYL